MKHPNKAVMALGDRVWAVAEGVEGRGAAGGSVDRQASPGRRTGIGMPPKRGAHGSRLRADEKALRRDHVSPSAGARCGKAARRDLCGGR